MSSSSSSSEATISIPSLVIVLGILFISYRWFFSSHSSSNTSSRNRPRYTAAHVEQISQMFPQLSRRDIMWDLQRNGGSVQATTERVLMGRALDPAPPTFVPPIAMTTTSSATAGTQQPVKAEVDLITRYNLQGRIGGKGKEREEEEVRAGWAGSKEDRQKILQRRRDEMILNARRKMMEREEGETAGS